MNFYNLNYSLNALDRGPTNIYRWDGNDRVPACSERTVLADVTTHRVTVRPIVLSIVSLNTLADIFYTMRQVLELSRESR